MEKNSFSLSKKYFRCICLNNVGTVLSVSRNFSIGWNCSISEQNFFDRLELFYLWAEFFRSPPPPPLAQSRALSFTEMYSKYYWVLDSKKYYFYSFSAPIDCLKIPALYSRRKTQYWRRLTHAVLTKKNTVLTEMNTEQSTDEENTVLKKFNTVLGE